MLYDIFSVHCIVNDKLKKSGLTLEPTYQMVDFSDPVSNVDPLKYATFELAAGIRYYTPQYIFDNSPYWKPDLRKISFILGFKLFHVR